MPISLYRFPEILVSYQTTPLHWNDRVSADAMFPYVSLFKNKLVYPTNSIERFRSIHTPLGYLLYNLGAERTVESAKCTYCPIMSPTIAGNRMSARSNNLGTGGGCIAVSRGHLYWWVYNSRLYSFISSFLLRVFSHRQTIHIHIKSSNHQPSQPTINNLTINHQNI